MTRGDIDGFFGLALDNLVQLLLINSLCRNVLGFDDDLLLRHVLPGAAVSLLVGNLFYSWQAKKLAERTGRTDVCALPYGINTVSLIAYVFLVMAPAKGAAEAAGAADPARVAWQAGLVACFGCGLIEFVGAFVAERIRKATPRAALLATLAGIALGFISLAFLFRTYERPIVGLTTLGIILLTYFGGVRFRGKLPGGLVAVALGTALYWAFPPEPPTGPPSGGGLYLPIPVVGDLWEAFRTGHALTYLSVIIPMGLFNVIGSLQNIESAEAAGDSFPTAPSLAVNGLGSVAAALFGSCFPTTIYIGHPGWKGMGARAGYSVLNGIFFTIVCLTGLLAYIAWAVPVDAGMAIVLWIGIVITAQAFQATPREHAPAVVVGLLPGVAAWGTMMALNGLRAAGLGTPDKPFDKISGELLEGFRKTSDTFLGGALALDQGFIFASMILAAVTVGIIERRFVVAALWCFLAALLAGFGLIHSYQWEVGTTSIAVQRWHLGNFAFATFKPAWDWAFGYLIMGGILLVAPWLTVPGEPHSNH